VIVCYEAVRLWCGRFGPQFAERLRPYRRRTGRRGFVDDVFTRMNVKIHYLWPVVDQNGAVADILVQAKRDRAAAERFFRHLLHSSDTVPHTVVTDRPRSYSAALPQVLPKVRHQRGNWLNNRAGSPISRHVNASGVCAGLSHQNRRSDFFPSTASSLLISDLDAIDSVRIDTGRHVSTVFISGTRPCRRARSRSHNRTSMLQRFAY
jgi:hypothetical protein